MRIKPILLGMCLLCMLTGCKQEEKEKKTEVTTISNVNNIQFQIPSSLREGAQPYNDFMENKVKVTNDFDYGIVETVTTHTYKLTDYEGYYLYCTDSFPFTTNLAYIQDIEMMQEELEDSFTDMSLSDFQYLHENNTTQIIANIQFTPVFEDETNIRRIEKARGMVVLYGIEEKQFLFVYADNNGILPEEDYNNLFNSLTYTKNESSLYEESNRTIKEYETDNCGINLHYNEMGREKENNLVIPSYNNAVITTTIYNSENTNELTDEEIITFITQEEVKERTTLWKDIVTAKDTNKIWQGRTYKIVDMEDNQYTSCIYSTSIGKTIITISAKYYEDNNPTLRRDVNDYIKDLVKYSETTKYIGLDGNLVQLIQEPTTEVTTQELTTTETVTEMETEATTQGTTEASTEATTEVTTQATTEVTTQATTQAATQATKKPQQSTTEKKTTKKKKNNNSDLDVEW